MPNLDASGAETAIKKILKKDIDFLFWYVIIWLRKEKTGMDNETIIKTIKEEGLFDFLANYYYMLSKETIKAISLDAMWALEQSGGNYQYAQKYVIEQLKEDEQL